MEKFKVVATDGLDKDAAETLQKNPHIALSVHKGVAKEELIATVADADLILLRSATVLDGAVLRQLPKLKGILRAGVGTDNIDVKAASDLGIWVWNAPTGNYQATAELAIGLLFAVARKITVADQGAKAGKWLKKEIGASGHQLSGATLGLFGAGNIGMRVAQMATGLGMKVQICDPVFTDGHFKKVDFDELLKTSDYISIHAPLMDSTRHSFDLRAFSKMKPGACLIHAARGGIVKDEDLVTALEKNLIAGAGLDVFEKEPTPVDDVVYAKLLKDARVVATPHLGASTHESQRLVGLESAEKIEGVVAAAKNSALSAPRPLNNPQTARLRLNLKGVS